MTTQAVARQIVTHPLQPGCLDVCFVICGFRLDQSSPIVRGYYTHPHHDDGAPNNRKYGSLKGAYVLGIKYDRPLIHVNAPDL